MKPFAGCDSLGLIVFLFFCSRFGKKKDDKSKDSSKVSKSKLDALSEEELDQRDGYEQQIDSSV